MNIGRDESPCQYFSLKNEFAYYILSYYNKDNEFTRWIKEPYFMEKKLKKSDKVLYVLILAMGVITAIVLGYFLLFVLMEFMNSSQCAEILMDMNVYHPFYEVLNGISSVAILVLLSVFFTAIPYFILSIILCVFFIIKYVKYKGEKKKQIIKTTILGIAILFFVFGGFTSLPWTSQYEIKVGAKVNDVTNAEVQDFLKKELKDNPYVEKIQIASGFPDDYVVKIYYRDIGKKVKHTSLWDSDYYFVKNNTKDITNLLEIKTIIMTLIGEGLYIYFVIYILKEFKRIAEE